MGVSVMIAGVENKVVARFRDGKIVKGFTNDFFPNKDVFHISATERGKDLTEVLVPDLKALFFVKSFAGKKDHRKHDHPDVLEKLRKTAGIKLKIIFSLLIFQAPLLLEKYPYSLRYFVENYR